MLVLAMMMQPSDSSRSTNGELTVAGLKHNEAIPIELSTPMTSNESLTLIGNPWRGPMTLFSRARNSSKSFALCMADEKSGSVIQLVSCCAIAVRLQNAVVTSNAESFRDARAESRVLTEYVSVKIISSDDRIPHSRGICRTFCGPYFMRGGSFGSIRLGILHCLGSCVLRYACLRLAITCQGASVVL